MRDFLRLQLLALVAAGLTVAGLRTGAQSFGLLVGASADSVGVSNSITYTVNVTNLTFLSLVDAQVTNAFSGSFLFVSASGTQGAFTNSGSNVVFDLGQFPFPGIAQFSLTVQPTAPGSFTNTVTVSSIVVTNTATTNLVVAVTNATADLGVILTGPAQLVIANDLMVYTVTVTNGGPGAAPNVMLTNTLPPGVGYQSASPGSPAPSVAGSNIVFSLGTIASGASTNFLLTVQPTNAGALIFSAFVNSAAVTDPNPSNNLAVTNILVTNYLAAQLTAFTNSAQTVNLQNGLVEQSICVTNGAAADVPAVRLVVTGLTNQLFNAVGTNNGMPFVDFSAVLGAGQKVSLLLQYFPRKSFPFANPQLQAFALPAKPNWTPPVGTLSGTNPSLNRIVRLSNGNMLIEWFAIPNRAYTVIYSDNILFSNALIAPPSVTAPANEVQWIDYGPPATVSTPASVGSRYYRILLNP